MLMMHMPTWSVATWSVSVLRYTWWRSAWACNIISLYIPARLVNDTPWAGCVLTSRLGAVPSPDLAVSSTGMRARMPRGISSGCTMSSHDFVQHLHKQHVMRVLSLEAGRSGRLSRQCSAWFCMHVSREPAGIKCCCLACTCKYSNHKLHSLAHPPLAGKVHRVNLAVALGAVSVLMPAAGDVFGHGLA